MLHLVFDSNRYEQDINMSQLSRKKKDIGFRINLIDLL